MATTKTWQWQENYKKKTYNAKRKFNGLQNANETIYKIQILYTMVPCRFLSIQLTLNFEVNNIVINICFWTKNENTNKIRKKSLIEDKQTEEQTKPYGRVSKQTKPKCSGSLMKYMYMEVCDCAIENHQERKGTK